MPLPDSPAEFLLYEPVREELHLEELQKRIRKSIVAAELLWGGSLSASAAFKASILQIDA